MFSNDGAGNIVHGSFDGVKDGEHNCIVFMEISTMVETKDGSFPLKPHQLIELTLLIFILPHILLPLDLPITLHKIAVSPLQSHNQTGKTPTTMYNTA